MSTHSSHAAVTSTVAGLSDDRLLEQTRRLASLDHQIHVFVIDHLCEIEARRIYLDRGFSSLFDYVKRGLGYTDAATWRRIGAMKLCTRIEGVRERLWDGSLTLDAAAQLQAAFERRNRFQRREREERGAGPASALRTNGSARPAPARSAQGSAAPEPRPMLDLSAQKALVEQAAGKSTREVRKMLADVDPALAVPADRLRPLGEGRWELKAVIDAECQRGLEQLKGLLSHVDPYMTLGQLVGRLVREGLDRHDPARPPRRGRAGGAVAGADRPPAAQQGASSAADAASEPKRSATQADVRTSTAQAQPAGPCTGVRSPAPRPSQPAGAGSMRANGRLDAEHRATSAPKRSARSGGTGASASRTEGDSNRRAPSAPKRSARAGGAGVSTSRTEGDPTRPTPAAPRRSAPSAGTGASAPKTQRNSDGRATSAGTATARPADMLTSAPKEGARAGRAIPAAVRREIRQRDGDAAAASIRAAGAGAVRAICRRSTGCSRTPWAAAPSRINLRRPCAAHHRALHTASATRLRRVMDTPRNIVSRRSPPELGRPTCRPPCSHRTYSVLNPVC